MIKSTTCGIIKTSYFRKFVLSPTLLAPKQKTRWLLNERNKARTMDVQQINGKNNTEKQVKNKSMFSTEHSDIFLNIKPFLKEILPLKRVGNMVTCSFVSIKFQATQVFCVSF